MKTPIKLFISYSGSDAAKVDKIARDLSLIPHADGTPRYKTWQDKHNLPPASPNWWDAIIDAIIDCDIFVFNLSRASLQSEVCRTELDYAYKRNRPIIPIVLEGEFFLNIQSGKYDLPNELWALCPEWLREIQLIFYAGTKIYEDFQKAVTLFEHNPPRDIPLQRPLNPNDKSVHGSNHAVYDAACDYAERLAFADAEKHFSTLVRRNDPDYADAAVGWLEIIRIYTELIEIHGRRGAPFVFNKRWSSYVALFPTEFLAEIFDPKDFSKVGKLSEEVSPPPRREPAPIDYSRFQLLCTIKGHTGSVQDCAFSPDGRILASASDDRTVRLWDATDGQFSLLHTLEGHNSLVLGCAFSPDGRTLASTSSDKTVCLWDVSSSQPALTATLKGHTAEVTSCAFSPDGRILASASWDKTVRLWNVSTRKPALTTTLKGHTNWVQDCAFSPDGQLLASAAEDKTVCLWDTSKASPTLLHRLDVKSFSYSCAFSPNGRILATGSGSNIQLWDMTQPTPNPLHTLAGHSRFILDCTFSPDGRILATASIDKIAQLWDISGAQPVLIQTLEGHTADSVKASAFSSDGRTLATASKDKTIKIWDISN